MPMDEVTDEQRGAEQSEWARINPFAYGVNVGPEVYQGVTDYTASEQRGYDRAIAEVVAMLKRRALIAWAYGDRESVCDASAFEKAKRAIEAGEHKP